MCFQRKKSAEKEQAKPKAQPNPGNTEPTQAATPKKSRARPVQQVVIAMEPENEQKPRKREKPRKERRREDSDNTLEDIPSLMPEIELELLRERDQQASKDPLQFVSTRSGDNMAERARMLVTATEQQKRQREQRLEKTQSRVIEDDDNWQADLDTWRRKRKEAASSTSSPVTPPPYGSSVDYGVIRKNSTKEEILTIRSPEDSHDSGIENRTLSHSPSTSIDFSPRSVELTSPKSAEASLPPSYAPPPPPALDQVLIPLSPPAVASRQPPVLEQEDYPLPPTHLRKSHETELLPPNRASVSASFTAAPSRQRLEPFVAQSLKEHHGEKSVNADLTVELNREQKAYVSATKFPGRYNTRDDTGPRETASSRSGYATRSHDEKNKSASLVSTARYSYESGAPASGRLATSASTPNVSAKPVYRAVDIPFDDSTATYQPPKRDKDGLMTIVVDMGGQPVHKGFGFSVATERRRCFVDSVIVGTPADKQGLLIGDRIESINGERVDDKYPSAISRLLHESARNGEIVLRVERNHSKASFGSTPNLAAPPGSKFNQARSVFSDKQIDSYAEFKRKHSKVVREKPAPREYNSLPRSSSTGFIGNDYGRSEYGRSSDYRVTSLHDKRKPGKLDDFVPEVERANGHGYSTVESRNNYEETRTIRNYGLLGSNSQTKAETAVPKTAEEDDDTVPGKAYLRKKLRHVLKTTDFEEDLSDYMEPSYTIYAVPDELEEEQRIYRSRSDFHVVGKYGTGDPMRRKTERKEEISDVSHRFYDKDGRWVERAQSEERIIPIRREFGRGITETETTESRDWREVINEQRQPAPGRTADTRRIQEATSSLSNLPEIIDKKLEEQRRMLSDRTDHHHGRSLERRDKDPREVYERSEYTFYEKKYTPTFDHQPVSPVQEKERRQPIEKDYGYVPRETKDYVQEREVMRREVEEKKREAITREPENSRDQVVAVSGKHRCAHCGEELGRGAAMIVESLNLFYHLACFNCFVCKTPLGSGNTGADVRVREGRLHCQSCYSSDRLQLSKV